MLKRKNAKIFIRIAIFLVLVAFVITLAAVAINCQTLTFNTEYFFVYYSEQDDAQSASSISSAVESYGGAGYIVEVDGKYYITVACYYTLTDAQTVCANLKERGLDCSTLSAKKSGYALTTARARQNAQKYLNNFAVLDKLSKTLYGAANSLDSGAAGQEEAKAVLEFARTTLNGLALENADNCFLPEINYLSAECKDCAYGYIKSSSLRALQIAVIDCIMNIILC